MDFSTGPSTKLPVIADLGMPANAAETLDELPKELPSHPEVLATRFAVLKASGKWAEAAGVARGLTDFMEEHPQHWIWWAHATRRAESVEAAEEILERALDEHPEVAVIHYNLACHAAVQGQVEKARRKLDHAAGLDPEALELAVNDSDLANLH